MREITRVLHDSSGQTAVVMLIVASSAVLGWFLTSEQIPQKFARMMLETTSNKYLILFFLNIFFFIAGMFLHSAAAIILIVPIVMPLIRQIGVDPIHFGIIVTINLGVGQQTPPVATVLFTISHDRSFALLGSLQSGLAVYARSRFGYSASHLCSVDQPRVGQSG